MTAIFGQPTQDENLVPGWEVQANAPLNYGLAGNTGATYGPGQTGAGFPNPPQALDVQGENSAAYGESILINPVYADGTGPGGRTLPTNIGGSTVSAPAIPASGAVATNPTNLVATVVIAGGTLTAVKVGTAGQTFAQATQVGSGDGTYTVSPGGVIGMTWSVTPTSMTWSV